MDDEEETDVAMSRKGNGRPGGGGVKTYDVRPAAKHETQVTCGEVAVRIQHKKGVFSFTTLHCTVRSNSCDRIDHTHLHNLPIADTTPLLIA
jgi:hypothetical protein